MAQTARTDHCVTKFLHYICICRKYELDLDLDLDKYSQRSN